MTEVVSGTIAGPRVAAVLSASFAVIAGLLALVGIYGVMTFVVTTRTREIGIRSALGADRPAILGLVARQAMGLAGGGTAAGLIIAWAITRLLKGFVYRVEVTSLVTYVALSAGMLVVALLASAGPAIRAARVSPVVALTED